MWLCDQELRLVTRSWRFPLDLVHIEIVSAKIARLCEVFIADVTLIWSLVRVFTEVISQIAALTKDHLALGILAAIILLRALAILAVHLDHLMPVRRNAVEIFHWTELLHLSLLGFKDGGGWVVLLTSQLQWLRVLRWTWRAESRSCRLSLVWVGTFFLSVLERDKLRQKLL